MSEGEGAVDSLELHYTSTLPMTNVSNVTMKQNLDSTTFLFLFQLVYVIVVK